MSAASEKVAQWSVEEIKLSSRQAYANPYKDVAITAIFTGPQGQTIVREAFWCGGNLWKLRFAPIATGIWTWKTTCSDTRNEDLHNRAGTIECRTYEGDLPLYRHGFIHISDNGRYFMHADGTPFFWLGDTHWQMPDTERVDECNHPGHAGKTCPYGGQFQHLAADRKAKGFTVYQTYPSANNPAWWSSKYDSINPERFERLFDVQMDHLARQGFVIALGVSHFIDSTRIPVDDLRRFSRYLVARYGAYPIVWITCQEMSAPEDDGKNRMEVWRSVAEEISRADGYGHPHSAHQWVLDVATRPIGGETWHDWFALQGGHIGSQLTSQSCYAGYYAFRPTKPMIETEAMYEKVDCGGVADTNDARMSAWKAMLCGCAGYTYGAAGVWLLKWDPSDTRGKEYNHQIDGWYAGMDLPGSGQMRVLKEFFLRLPWTMLTPRFADPVWSTWEDAERCVLATVGNSLYVIYFYGKESKGTLKQLDPEAVYEARWFDPRKGDYAEGKTEIQSPDGEWAVPEKPSDLDWILLLEKKN